MAGSRVKFREIATVVLFPDDRDSKAARRGPWEAMARDRARFERRIQLSEKAISWVFERSHRDRARAQRARHGNSRAPPPPPPGRGEGRGGRESAINREVCNEETAVAR